MKRSKLPSASPLGRKTTRPAPHVRSLDGDRSYRDLVALLPVGVYRTTPDGRILEANPALAKMLGYTEAELKRRSVFDLYADASQRRLLLKNFDSCKIEFSEFRLRRKDGRTIWGRDYCRPIKNGRGRIASYNGIIVDITGQRANADRLKKAYARLRKTTIERKQMIKKLESLSITDELTGIFNRRGFRMFAQQYLSIAARKIGPTFLLFIDVDNLKRINDVFGHHVGDLALIRLASVLRGTFRTSDIKGRMGGDEFAVYPIDATLEGIDIVLARLRDNIQAANEAPDAIFELSISAGVAAFDPENPSTVDELLVRADAMMYEEKRKKEIQ
jgi:diguanylate cyclase (GGDEF)-like protein/PAS domain S-box-containing protein